MRNRRISLILRLTALAVFALTLTFAGAAERPSERAAAQEGQGKLLYYVDAGNMSSDPAGLSDSKVERASNNVNTATPRYPSKTLAPVMTDAGYSFPTSSVIGEKQLYNSVNDNIYGADAVTGKYWGIGGTSQLGWNTARFLKTDHTADGYETMRFVQNTVDENPLIYKFEVDDNTTALRVFIGTCLKSNWNPDEVFSFFINGAAKGNMSVVKSTINNYTYEDVTGVYDEGTGKYFVTLQFGEKSTVNQQSSVCRIFIETEDHVTPLYTGGVTLKQNQMLKQGETGAVNLIGMYATTADENSEIALTADNAAVQAAINSATAFSQVTVTASHNGIPYSGKVYAVPKTLEYFVDAGANHNDVLDAFNAVYPNTLNGADYISDRAFTAGSWGYTTTNVANWRDDPIFYRSIRNINSGNSDPAIGYDFMLENGSYNVYYGVIDMWTGVNRNRPGIITAGALSASFNTESLAQFEPLFCEPLEGVKVADGKLTVTVRRDGSVGAEPALSYLAISRVYDIFDVPEGVALNASPYHLGETPDGTFPTPYLAGFTFEGWFTDSGYTAPATTGDLTQPVTATTKFYAKMTAASASVSFDYGDGADASGTPAGSIMIAYGQTLTGLPVAVPVQPEIRLFDGWYTAASGGTKYQNGDIWRENAVTTLYARYRARQVFDIVYTLNDSSVGKGSTAATNTSPASYTEGVGCALVNPSRNGYTFVSWHKNAGLTDPATAIGENESGNVALFAEWTAKNYTVTLNYGGGVPHAGDTTGGSITAVFDAAVVLPASPELQHNIFDGWYTQANGGGKKYTGGDIYTETSESPVLYAYFYADASSSISYVLNDSSNGQGSTAAVLTGAPVRYEHGVGCALPSPVRTGYTFAGWYKDSALTILIGSVGASEDSDLNLYAKWNALTYTVTYNVNGGDQLSSGTYAAAFDASYTLAVPTRTGHEFLGWFTAAAGGVRYTDDSGRSAVAWTGTEGKTLYAQWDIATYTVSYELNGGRNHAGNLFSYSYGTGFNLGAPSKDHNLFEGWYTENTGGEKVTAITAADHGDKKFYARWTVETYAVNYTLNGGENHADNAAVYTYGEGLALKAPSRTGYVFGGWFTNQNLTGPVTQISATDEGAFNVYAKWIPVYTAVTLDYAGGKDGNSASSGSAEADYGIAVSGLPALTRDGYVFGGWYTAANGGGDKVQNGDTWSRTEETFTLYAFWTHFTVTFEVSGGSGIQPVTGLLGGDKIAKPANPSKKGCKFAGWYKDSGYSAAWDFETDTVSESITLYAKWENGGCNSSAASSLPVAGAAFGLAAVVLTLKKRKLFAK